MVPSTSQVPQPLPRVLYSLHIDDEEPISCVVRIRDNGADMVLIRSRHDTPWRMRINSSYPEDVVWKVGMGIRRIFPTMVYEAHRFLRQGESPSKQTPISVFLL